MDFKELKEKRVVKGWFTNLKRSSFLSTEKIRIFENKNRVWKRPVFYGYTEM